MIFGREMHNIGIAGSSREVCQASPGSVYICMWTACWPFYEGRCIADLLEGYPDLNMWATHPTAYQFFKIKIKSSLDTSSGRWAQMYFMKNGTFKASPARPKIKKQVYKYCCIDCQQKTICSCLTLKKNSSEVSPFLFYLFSYCFLTVSWWGQEEEPLMKEKNHQNEARESSVHI